MTEQTLVVVGAGHVAAVAARTLRRRGFDGRIVLVGDEPIGPYQRPPLSKECLSHRRGRRPVAARPAPGARRTTSRCAPAARSSGSPPTPARCSSPTAPPSPPTSCVLATGGRPRSCPVSRATGCTTSAPSTTATGCASGCQPGRRIGVLGGGFLGTEVARPRRSPGAPRSSSSTATRCCWPASSAPTSVPPSPPCTGRRGVDLRLGGRSARSGPAPTASSWSPARARETVDDLVVVHRHRAEHRRRRAVRARRRQRRRGRRARPHLGADRLRRRRRRHPRPPALRAGPGRARRQRPAAGRAIAATIAGRRRPSTTRTGSGPTSTT